MLNIKSIFWYIRQFAWLTRNLAETSRVKKMLKTHTKEECDKRIWYDAENWAKYIVRSTGSEVEVIGADNIINDRPVLIVSNHQGFFDIPILMGNMTIPIGFIAKTDLKKFPFLSDWMELIHCLFMDRSDMKQSIQVITDGIKQIKSGQSMVIFPEGTRSKGGPVGQFHAGSFKLATKSKAPIIPVTIDGSYKIMEAGHNNITPSHIRLIIHEPVYTEGLTRDEAAELPEIVRKTIIGGFEHE